MNQFFLFPQPASPNPQYYQLFLALFPPQPAREIAANLARVFRTKYCLRTQPLRPDRLHASLYSLGRFRSVPREVLETPEPAVHDCDIPPFDVAFDRALSFENNDRRPFVITGGDGLAALKDFHHHLRTWVNRTFGVPNLRTSFTPHITLLYDRQNIPQQPVDPVRWQVTEFSRVLSVVGQSRYVHLDRWRLTG